MNKPRNMKTRKVIVSYIKSYKKDNAFLPSVQEIQSAAGHMSLSTTAGYLRRMVDEGILRRTDAYERNYDVAPKFDVAAV